MYSEAFCKIYNEFGWNYYPEAFGEQLMEWVRHQNLTIRTSMDLACGTGVLCEYLQDRGIESAGMDFSAEMIKVAVQRSHEFAAQKNPLNGLPRHEIPYEVADMITYCPDTQYDLVTCTGDALNHITRISDVGKIFRNVYQYLAPGGYFLFDLLNENEVDLNDPIDFPWDEHVHSTFVMTQDENGWIHLHTSVYEDDALNFEEDITELIHDPYTVRELLKQAGFQIERVDHSLLPDTAGKGLTWFFIAKKPES